MQCSEFKEGLQRRLDGETDPRHEMEAHVAECAYCRSLEAAARRLEAGLRLLAPPAPPARLSQHLVQALFAQRRQQRRRRAVLTLAMAASLLMAAVIGRPYWQPRHAPAGGGNGTVEAFLPERVEEAGSALTSLVRKTTEHILEQGQRLVPAPVEGQSLLVNAGRWENSLEPPVQSIRAAGVGLGSGLEPVVGSARRAVQFFLRDVPTKNGR